MLSFVIGKVVSSHILPFKSFESGFYVQKLQGDDYEETCLLADICDILKLLTISFELIGLQSYFSNDFDEIFILCYGSQYVFSQNQALRFTSMAKVACKRC